VEGIETNWKEVEGKKEGRKGKGRKEVEGRKEGPSLNSHGERSWWAEGRKSQWYSFSRQYLVR
jgi:hypothetical protein